MYCHQEQRPTKFTQDQLYDLVSDIEAYPEFLPWCRHLRITSRQEYKLIADLIIGFKIYSEKFTSIVHLDPDHYVINVTYQDGPFKYLTSKWQFLPPNSSENGAIVDFYIEFAFKTKILDKLLGTVFNEAIGRMIRAFEERAHQLYD